MKMIAYRLREKVHSLGISYYRYMRTIEISLLFWNILIWWGKDYEWNEMAK